MNYKTILITGSAKRIGADLARGLHMRGHNIIIHYNHSEHEARDLASALNAGRPESVMAIQADYQVGGSELIFFSNYIKY